MIRLSTALLLSVATLAACSRMETSSVPAATKTDAIVNGQEVKKATPLSSRLVMVTGLDTKSGDAAFCTGSLLPGNLVLTAAHCLDDVGDDLYVDFGLKFEITRDLLTASYARKVTARRHISAYDNGDAETRRASDLAVLKFDGALPAGYTTFAMPDETTTSFEPADTDSLYMIGYGTTSPLLKTQGVLRVLQVDGSRIDLDSSTDNYLVLDGTKSGLCLGDSGGPLAYFNDKTPQILGVVSRVSPQSKDVGQACSGADIFTRIGPNLKWLRATVDELQKL